jgi:CRISPR/Cas system-associated exonuclease Cas4 (RecB family)
MEPDRGWTSPSDLADYAYCPRSHWYRHHPPAEGPSAAAVERTRAGVRYHDRILTAERRRAERGATYWVGVLAGLGLVVGGVVWLFHP